MIEQKNPFLSDYGKRCANEATRWIEVDCTPDNTFYLCADHADELSHGADEEVIIFNPSGSSIEHKELAVYSCAPDCDICA